MLYGDRQRDLAAVFRAVAGGAAGLPPGQLLRMAVTGGLETGPDVVGCSVTEQDGSRYRTTVYDAGGPSLALDLVQYQAGRGPCLAALRDQRTYLADDPAGLGRSVPGWIPAAARLGVESVLSLPRPGLPRGAGINFYGAAAASFRSPEAAARAALMGRLAGLLLDRPEAGTAGWGHGTGQAAVTPQDRSRRPVRTRRLPTPGRKDP